MCSGERKRQGKGTARKKKMGKKRWNDAEKMLAKDMRNVKGNDVLWKKGRWLSEQQEQQHRRDWWDERRDTSGALGGRKRCRRRVKEWVHIQLIKTTCVCLRWGHRSAAHTCEERMPSLAPIRGTARLFSQFIFSCQLSVLAKTFNMSSPLRLSPQTDK